MNRIICVFALAACGHHGLPTTTLRFGDIHLTVEIADDEAERAQGLMHRDELANGAGMVFVYPDSKPRHFWMKDTRIPLSIAYVDEQGVIVKIADMSPLSTARTPSLYPAKYAIEVPQGWFGAHEIAVGQRVDGLLALKTER